MCILQQKLFFHFNFWYGFQRCRRLFYGDGNASSDSRPSARLPVKHISSLMSIIVRGEDGQIFSEFFLIHAFNLTYRCIKFPGFGRQSEILNRDQMRLWLNYVGIISESREACLLMIVW